MYIYIHTHAFRNSSVYKDLHVGSRDWRFRVWAFGFRLEEPEFLNKRGF